MSFFCNFTFNFNFGMNNMFNPMNSCFNMFSGIRIANMLTGSIMTPFNNFRPTTFNNGSIWNCSSPNMGYSINTFNYTGFNTYWDNLANTQTYTASNPFTGMNFGNFWNNINNTQTNSTSETKTESTSKEEPDSKSAPSTSATATATSASTAKINTNITSKSLEEYKNKNKEINTPKKSQLDGVTGKVDKLMYCSPEIVDTIVELNKIAKAKGYTIKITSAFRTHEEQQTLLNKLGEFGKGGLAAKPGTSLHEYGQAVDINILKNGKKIKIGKDDTSEIVACLKRHNMNWGGDFKSTKEEWHFDTGNAGKNIRNKLKQA